MNSQQDSRVSIIIPHLNQPDFLGRCLAALAPQVEAEPGADVIVVDNGSRQMPEKLCAAFPFVRLASEHVPGPGPARNRGIALSGAPILAFIDADCLPHPRWLATILAELRTRPEIMVIGGDVRIGAADPQRLTMLEAYESVFAFRQKEYIERMGFSGTGNLAMRRAAFEQVGPFGGIEVAEDRDWGRRATRSGFAILYVPAMIVYHPARSTFEDLRRKWDRHVSHDFEELPAGLGAKVRWLGLACAILASGVVDIRKIIASDGLKRWRDRALAALVLLRIRAYRAWRMAYLLVSPPRDGSRSWNRS
jgi:GT2 family glycosyltransferase